MSKKILNFFIIIFCLFVLISDNEISDDQKNKLEQGVKRVHEIIGDASNALKDTTKFVKNHKFNPKYCTKSKWGGGVQ